MFSLIVVLVIAAVSLIVLLWVGTFLFQGYVYTEPTQGLFWQAPAAGVILTLGLAVWCFAIALWPGAGTTNLPINTIFKFSPWVDMADQPAPRIHAIKKNRMKSSEKKDGDIVVYETKWSNSKPPRKIYETSQPKPWQSQDVIAMEVEKPDGSKVRFDLIADDAGGKFVSPDGWVMPEDKDGAPTGIPVKFNYVRLILNIVFNVGHFLAWYILLWLMLRYQNMHALGLAFVMWVIVTVGVLPIILEVAGGVAQSR